MNTPQAWLEHFFAKRWPKGLKPKDYSEAIQMVVDFGKAMRREAEPEASPGRVRVARGPRAAPLSRKERSAQVEEFLLKHGPAAPAAMAKHLGLNATSIYPILKRCGAKKVAGTRGRGVLYMMPNRTEAPHGGDVESKVVETLKSGPKTMKEIAKLVGASPNYVGKVRRKLGFESAGMRGTAELWSLPTRTNGVAPSA